MGLSASWPGNLSCAGKGGPTCWVPDLSWASLGCGLGECEAESGPVVPLPVTGAGSWWGWEWGGLRLFQSAAHEDMEYNMLAIAESLFGHFGLP